MSERIIYKHVAVIGMDGMGNFCKDTDTPNFDRIFENGATTYYGFSMVPTISAENWGAMLLGAKPTVHGLTNSIVDNREYTNKELPSVFTTIRHAHPDAVLTSICNWNPINHGIIEHDINVNMDTAGNDEELCDKIIPAIADKPEFLFVQFDDIDGAGHGYCYGSPEHLAQITENDRLLGRIYDEYKAQGILEETLFVVIADHGGRIKGHGGFSDTEKYIFAGVAGKGIVKSEIDTIETKDIASIVLYALGIDIPEYNENGYCSQVPDGIFPWYSGNYIKVEAKPYNPIFKETPAFKSESGLASFFDEDKIKLACFFDNSMRDETGKYNLKEYGTCKYYSVGVRSDRTELGKTGYVEVEDFKLGNGSFTVSVWMMIDRSLLDEPVIVTNKNWENGSRNERGFALALRNADTIFNLAHGERSFDISTPIPTDISDGWVNGIYAVDLENKEVRVYNNFKLAHTVKLGEKYLAGFEGQTLSIGIDATGLKESIVPDTIVNIDDLFIFDGAFTDDDVKKLQSYYN